MMSASERHTRKGNASDHHHERKRSGHPADAPTVNTGAATWISEETPTDYLYRNGTTSLLKEAIERVIENRPDDPISFLADFFRQPDGSVLESACHRLGWCHYSNKAYQKNILEVYNSLVTSTKKNNSNLKYLSGEDFNQLLAKLAECLPEEIADMCVSKMEVRQSKGITFSRFYHDVLLLHVVPDYIRTLGAVYQDLDVNGNNRADDTICRDMLNSLVDNSDNSMDALCKRFDKALTDVSDVTDKSNKYMDEETFVRIGVEIFVQNV